MQTAQRLGSSRSVSSRLVSLAAVSLVAGCLLAGPRAASAQITNTDESQATPIPDAGHSYIHLLSETVNPADGSVSLRIEIPAPKGRGPSIPGGLAYDSNGAEHVVSNAEGGGMWVGNTGYVSNGGWSDLVPALSEAYNQLYPMAPDGEEGICNVTSDFVWTGPDGERHAIRLAGAEPAPDCSLVSGGVARQSTGGDGDISAKCGSITLGCSWTDSVTVIDGDGTRYSFPTNYSLHGDQYGLPTLIEDRNGNEETIADSGNGTFTVTDSLGRQALAYSGFGSSGNTIDVEGQGVYTVYWGSAPVDFTPEAIKAYGSACLPPSADTTPNPVITELVLPGGQAFHFYYDSTYGLLDEIVYPDGGYVRYVWAMGGEYETAIYLAADFGPNNPDFCQYEYTPPVITDRYVSPDGSHETLHQHFAYSTSFGSDGLWNQDTTTETEYDLAAGTNHVTQYQYAPMLVPSQPGDWPSGVDYVPVETSIAQYGTDGSALKTTEETWEDDQTLTSRSTCLGAMQGDTCSGWEAETTWSPGARHPSQVEEYGYGWGAPGSLLRQENITYAYFTGINIVGRPASVAVEDGSGCLWSLTEYGYDQSPLTAITGVVQHDDTGYGTGYTTRGNLTTESKWVGAPQSGCVSLSAPGGTTLDTAYGYDETGQRLTMTEPNGATTSYSYVDNFASGSGSPGGATDAYLTQVTDAMGLTDKYSWDFDTGSLATRAGPNGNVTSYAYSAPFNRLAQVNDPDGGETQYAYSDTPGDVYTETSREVSAGVWNTSYADFDGLGHQVATASTNGNGGWNRVDTSYDGEGEAAFRSYPCTAPSPTGAAQCTAGDSFAYDALGRPTLTTHSDGTTIITSYAGRATEVEDEGNGGGRVTRVTQTGALGNLASVCEVTSTADVAGNAPAACGQDIAATGFLTTYAYSPLGDLESTAQGAESRAFTYDSLSRLLTAQNPETGTTSYVYGSNGACPSPNAFAGDLVSRTDARGIRTCYRYDPDDRLTQKSYSDGTPSASIAYGQTSAFGASLAGTRGRVSSEYSASDAGEMFSYDADGQVENSWQFTPNTYGKLSYPFGYARDLGGDITQSDFDNGAQILTTSYNAAQQTTGVQSNNSGTLISDMTYGPWGHETGAELGTAPITETRAYDERGRPALEQDGTLYSWTVGSYAPDGDVLSSTDSVNGSWTYTMNALNQLTEACKGGCSAAAVSYSYDRYGNRWGAATSGAMPAEPQPNLTFNTGNRIAGWTYDADGNVLNDGTHTYQYDAENRLISVDNGTTASYEYGAEGRRVQEDVGGVVKQFVYGEGGQNLTVLDGSNNVLQEELRVNGEHFATWAGGGVYYQLSDWLATTRLTAYNASPVCVYTSSPYGESLSQSCGTNLLFTGKYHDSETGFDDFGARYYNEGASRFLTSDPSMDFAIRQINPQRWNKYAYAVNNPLTFTDPDGRDAIAVDFQHEVPFAGHEGVISILSDGSAEYARFGPEIPGTPFGRGQIREDTDLPRVTFENGAPTPASLKALIDAVAKYERQDPGSVRFNYFKTSDAETEAMRAYIVQQQADEATASGGFCDYSVIGNNCASFSLSALTAGGAINEEEAASLSFGQSTAPNWMYEALSELSAFSMNEFDLLNLVNQQACVSVSDSASGYHSGGCQP